MMDDIGCTFLWCMYSNFFWQTNDLTIETAPTEKNTTHKCTCHSHHHVYICIPPHPTKKKTIFTTFHLKLSPSSPTTPTTHQPFPRRLSLSQQWHLFEATVVFLQLLLINFLPALQDFGLLTGELEGTVETGKKRNQRKSRVISFGVGWGNGPTVLTVKLI